MRDTKTLTISNNITQFEEDTILLGRVSRETPEFAIELMCSNDLLSVDLFVDSGCALNSNLRRVDADSISVNSTNSTTTEVSFFGSSNIYLLSGSYITFCVEILTASPATLNSVLLVVFNNYTRYVNYLNTDSPNTDEAYMVLTFETEGVSNVTFSPELETSYFFAIKSSAGTYFHYSYNGVVYRYSHLDYERAECNLPAELCEKVNCTFSYDGIDTCILSYISPALSSRPFVDIRTNTSQNRKFKKRWVIAPFVIATCLILVSVAVLIIVCVRSKYIRSRSGNFDP